jgi:hypothetical protein
VALRPTLSSGLPFTTNRNIIALRTKKTKEIKDLGYRQPYRTKKWKILTRKLQRIGLSKKQSRSSHNVALCKPL